LERPCSFIEIAIGIEIVCPVAMGRMLLANSVASDAETGEQGHDLSIPIAIPIPISIVPMWEREGGAGMWMHR